MTAAAGRLTEPRVVAGAGTLLTAAAVGLLAGYDPKLALAAAFGLGFILIVLADLAVGVAIFGTLTFLELAPVVGDGAVTLPKLAGLTLAISWFAAIATNSSRSRLLFSSHPGLTATIAFFLTWAALSGLWAEDSASTWTVVGRFALNAALFPIVFTAIREPKHLRWVAAGLIIGAAVAAGYGLVISPNLSSAATSLTSAGDIGRVSGTIGDPNQLAAVLVVGVVMSFALALDPARSTPTRSIAAGVAVLSTAVIFATVSRGGVLALATALVAALFLAGPRRGRMALTATVAIVASLTYFALFASDAQVERLQNADGGTGRTDIWKIGWRMVKDKPVRGVGAGNFAVSSIHYLLAEPGAILRDDFIVDDPKVAHNMYLEILAELGVVGLAAFLTLILVSLSASIRAASLFDRADEDGLALIARGLAVGLIALLAADFFLSDELGKLLWLLLSLGPATLAIAMRSAAAAEAAASPAPEMELSPGSSAS